MSKIVASQTNDEDFRPGSEYALHDEATDAQRYTGEPRSSPPDIAHGVGDHAASRSDRMSGGLSDKQLQQLSRLGAYLVSAFACLALVGWLAHFPLLTSFSPGLASTSAATAIGLAVCAFGIYSLTTTVDRHAGGRLLWRAGATIVIIVALYVLARYAVGSVDAGYLFGRALGRVSPATAACFVFLAIGVLTVDHNKGRFSAGLTVVGLAVVELDLVGYAYDIRALYKVTPFTSMALPTALVFGVLFVALMFARPRQGWIQYAVRHDRIGNVYRLLVPATIIIPFAFSYLTARATEYGWFDPSFGFAILTVAPTAVLGSLVYLAAGWLSRAELAADLLGAIVSSSDDAIIGKDLDGVITSWNQAAERLFGYTAAEAIGQPISILLKEQDLPVEQELLGRVGGNERIHHYETVRRRKDGNEVEVSVTLSPIRSAGGEVVGASSIARDITQKKRHELELQRSNRELEQFAYVASHDLQEPLRMVANYSELLAKRYRGKLDEKADMYIHYASDGARRMQRLVADLLSYSRVGSEGKPLVRVQSDAVVEDVLHSMQTIIRETNASVETAALPPVLADEAQLHRLFQNLIANAIKFHSSAPPQIRISAVQEADRWLFSIADNGIGIDMEYADRIFQMFQRLHERDKYPGSGIGLSIAKRIVERHGGYIWVDSTPGVGSTFYFTLKAAKD